MKYFYRNDFHELWSNTDNLIPGSQIIHLKNTETLGIERLLLVNNQENVRSPTVILPDLSPHLVVHQLESGQYRFHLIGPRTTSIFIDRKKRCNTYIIRFKAQVLRQYLNFPLIEICDQAMELEEWLGAKNKDDLLAKILGAPPELVFTHLLHLISSQALLPRSSRFHFANALLRIQRTQVTCRKVSEAARKIGISERYLHQLSKDQIGFSPKLIFKVLRFQNSLIYKQKDPKTSWAQIAQMAGYFDQSHMIDEYQQFLGASPGRFFGV